MHHKGIEIPPITPLVIEHRLRRLICTSCSTSTCIVLAAEVEASRYCRRLSALVVLLGSAFPLSFTKTQALLDHLLGAGGGRNTTAEKTASTAVEQLQPAARRSADR